MPTLAICTKCGAELAVDAPESLCSRCLLLAALEKTATAEDVTSVEKMPARVRYFGEYELLEEIARGGMGIVYRARQASLKRVVALKMMLSGAFASEVFLKRFRTEAEAAAQLSHPNIVSIYEVGEHDGQQYFTMRLIEGCTLAEKLKVSGRFPPRSAAGLLAKIARAVHYAHERGVLHRDLKPANILLDKSGEPFVADFGLAKVLEDETGVTRTEAILGTVSYMSPEQAEGKMKQLTTASDTFSLGVILYELLTGRLPFAGESNVEILRKITDQEVPTEPLRSAADRDLSTICLKCLEKDPGSRYRSSEALAEDLGRWMRGETIIARPGTNFEKLSKWVKRRPAIAALSATSLCLFVALGIASMVAAFRISKAKQAETLHRGIAEKTAEQLQINLYASELNIAFQTFNAGDRARTIALLEKQPVELRSFDWHYLWHRTQAKELFAFTNLPDVVTSLAFSPSGNVLAIQVYGNLHIWDWPDKTLVTNFVTGTIGDTTLFSPDGLSLVTTHRGARDGNAKLRLWNTATWHLLADLHGHEQQVSGAAFSPDGKYLASAACYPYTTVPGELKLWDVAGRKYLCDFEDIESYLIRCDFSPDSKTIAAVGGGSVAKLWDVESGRVVARLAGHENGVFGLKFSPAGNWLATGDLQGRVRLWNLTTFEPVVLGSHHDSVDGIAFTPDGRKIATVSRDHTVKLWDVERFREVSTLLGHEGRITCVDISPDGKTIVSGSRDQAVRAWSAEQLAPESVFARHDGMNVRIRFSPRGGYLLRHELTSGVITIWGGGADEPVLERPGAAFTFLAGATERVAIVGTNQHMQIWSLDPQRLTSTISNSIAVSHLTASADGTRLAVATAEGRLLCWNVETLRPETSNVSGFRKNSWLLFSPDGNQMLAEERAEGRITAWDIQSGRKIWQFDVSYGPSRSAVLSPDGNILATAHPRGSALLWNMTTHRFLGELKSGAGDVRDVAFSPDGRTLAMAAFEGVIKLWNVAAQQETATFRGHSSFVGSVTFSAQDSTLASASGDNTLRLWPAKPN